MSQPRPQRDAMPYRDCVGVALFNREGKVFLARRILTPVPTPQRSRPPGNAPGRHRSGRRTAAAPPIASSIEETSVRTIRLLAEAPDWIHYDLPDDVLGIALKGKYPWPAPEMVRVSV